MLVPLRLVLLLCALRSTSSWTSLPGAPLRGSPRTHGYIGMDITVVVVVVVLAYIAVNILAAMVPLLIDAVVIVILPVKVHIMAIFVMCGSLTSPVYVHSPV